MITLPSRSCLAGKRKGTDIPSGKVKNRNLGISMVVTPGCLWCIMLFILLYDIQCLHCLTNSTSRIVKLRMMVRPHIRSSYCMYNKVTQKKHADTVRY